MLHVWVGGGAGGTATAAGFTGAGFAAATAVDGPPREPNTANVTTPPMASAPPIITISRRLSPVLCGRCSFDAGAVAACTRGVGAAGAETDGGGTVDRAFRGSWLGDATSADEAARTTMWSAAHRSHRSQTAADPEISRPHDAQRFTRLLLASSRRTHTAGTSSAASGVPQVLTCRLPVIPNFSERGGWSGRVPAAEIDIGLTTLSANARSRRRTECDRISRTHTNPREIGPRARQAD